MKIQYFVRTPGPTPEDAGRVMELRKAGHKVIMSNGDFKKGFETGCDAVYLSAEFPHIEKWAVSNGVEVMKPAIAAEQEPVKEVKPDADALSEDSEKQEEKAEEEVKPRRRRRTKPAADDVV